MLAKPTQKTTAARKAHKPESRKNKTPKEISRELREQRALDPTKSEVEDYLTPSSGHFRS